MGRPLLDKLAGSTYGHSWAQSGHEKGYAANVSKWVVNRRSVSCKNRQNAAILSVGVC